MQINYQYYPKHIRMPNHLNDVVSIFNNVYNKIDSFNHNLKSNEVLAVINVYKTKQDFEEVCRFFDALYSSDRFNLPLNGILVIGY